MGKPNRPSQEKKNRERAKKERAQIKEQERLLRKETRVDRAAMTKQGIDPDLVGIYPGPQPVQEN
jgi:hypothetical protein